MNDRWSELEKLGRFRAEGLLTEAEFEAEKERLLAKPRRQRLVVLWISLGLLAAVAVFALWRLTDISSEKKVAVSEPPVSAAVAQAPREAPTLAQAFALAFPTPKRRVTIDGETTAVRFSPHSLFRLSPDTYVLLSRGKNLDDDSHAAGGFYAVTYLGFLPQLAIEGETFIAPGSLGGWGQPPELKIVTGLLARPVVQVTNGGSGQGLTVTAVDLVWLGEKASDVHVAAEDIEVSYDDLGADGSCEIKGRLATAPGDAFKVIYTGSYKAEVVYRKGLARYQTPSPLELYSVCPEGTGS
jgi:hypothetical protein